MKYAILGASGAVGTELGKHLAAQEIPFRAVDRSEIALKRAFAACTPWAEPVVADLGIPSEAARAVADVDTIFYTVGVPFDKFELHPQLTAVTLEAAAEAGVRRFVHLSTLYVYGRAQAKRITEDHPREPHTYRGRKRKEQEDLVAAADTADGMRTLILCPPDFYGALRNSLVYDVFRGALAGRAAKVIGPVDVPHEFVYVPDVAKALYKISAKDEAYGERWNMAGSGHITVRELAELVYGEAGRKPKLRVANKWLLRLLGLRDPTLKGLVEMHYLMTDPLFVDDARLRALLPDLHVTSYEDGARATLRRMAAAAEARKRVREPQRRPAPRPA